MYLRSIILLVWCVFSCNPSVKQDVNNLVGTWKVEGMERFEVWDMQDDKVFAGSAYTVQNGQKYFSERIEIKELDNQWVFGATVSDQNNGNTILFTHNKTVENKLSFENLNHDYPQKIQYQFIDNNTLIVSITGNGEDDYTYKQIKIRETNKE